MTDRGRLALPRVALAGLAGYRRAVRRAAITDAADLETEAADIASLLFALEHARDLARLGALRAAGPEAVARWRLRQALVHRALGSVIEDLENDSNAAVESLIYAPPRRSEEPSS